MKHCSYAIFAIVTCLVATQLNAAPLYGTYNYYDGFTADDTDSWVRQNFVGSIDYDGTNDNILLTENASNDANTRMAGKSNVSAENSIEVGEKVAFKIGNIQTSRWSTSTYIAAYLSDDATGATFNQNLWLMLQGGAYPGPRGWSYLDGGWTFIAGSNEDVTIFDRWVEFARPDANSIVGTVYSDAALTTVVATHTYSITLGANAYLGMYTDNKVGNSYFDDVTIAAIPEPASMILLMAGASMLWSRSRKDS